MDEIWSWIGWLAAGVATIVAIRGSIRFNVNEWLKERRHQKEENLRLLCPHVSAEIDENGNTVIRSQYTSPIGTAAYQCEKCGAITHDPDEPIRQGRYWRDNPKKLVERFDKMKKLAKKLGRSFAL